MASFDEFPASAGSVRVNAGWSCEQPGLSYYFLDLTALGRQEEWEEPLGRADSTRSATPDFAG
ncbi:hypothetical protein BH20ACT2_BH20ACT2_21320 [soil metagenome]